MLEKAALKPVRVAYERRNWDVDPQLVWRGKDEPDGSDVVPRALIDDLLRQTRERRRDTGGVTFRFSSTL